MNQCNFIGRLVRDPEIRYTVSAEPAAVAKYTLAVDRRYKRDGEPEADFFNLIAYGQNATFAERYLKQGIKMQITAHCQNRTYTNKEGRKIYITEFIVDSQEFVESKRTAGQPDPEPMPEEYDELPFC